MENIIGKTIEEIRGLELDGLYPIVENGVVTGTVDANYPEQFNNGNWEIVDDLYAVATEVA